MMQNEVIELIVLWAPMKINFLDTYTYSEFGQMLGEIENFRKIEKSYIIRKRELITFKEKYLLLKYNKQNEKISSFINHTVTASKGVCK